MNSQAFLVTSSPCWALVKRRFYPRDCQTELTPIDERCFQDFSVRRVFDSTRFVWNGSIFDHRCLQSYTILQILITTSIRAAKYYLHILITTSFSVCIVKCTTAPTILLCQISPYFSTQFAHRVFRILIPISFANIRFSRNYNYNIDASI